MKRHFHIFFPLSGVLPETQLLWVADSSDVTPKVADKSEQNRTEQNRTEQNRTEQNRTEQNRTEQNRTEQNRTEQIKPIYPRFSVGASCRLLYPP